MIILVACVIHSWNRRYKKQLVQSSQTRWTARYDMSTDGTLPLKGMGFKSASQKEFASEDLGFGNAGNPPFPYKAGHYVASLLPCGKGFHGLTAWKGWSRADACGCFCWFPLYWNMHVYVTPLPVLDQFNSKKSGARESVSSSSFGLWNIILWEAQTGFSWH